jgi:hypothetical protein
MRARFGDEEVGMSFGERLLIEARRATGDDTVQEVADFAPKGTAGASMAGAAAGGIVGGAAVDGDGWGSMVAQGAGSMGGLVAGQAAVGLSRHLPHHVAIAVSPTEVYILEYKGTGWAPHLSALGKIDRDSLGIEVHQRVSVRTVVLEDLNSGEKFQLEVSRLNLYHGKALVELLMMSEPYHDAEPTEDELVPSV